MSHVIITGGQGGSTEGAVAPNRLEINDLIKDGDQFSLYIQALIAIYDKPQDDSVSHFSIGGIHGVPYVRWEGAGDTSPIPGSEFGGYCAHGSVLFPTWHRPYVALYEQILQQHALEIALKYQDQERWKTAAENLRAPYWDWATNTVPPPEVVTLEIVKITTPDGEEAVPNPLIKYAFHPIDPSFPSEPSPYNSWPTTIRHPTPPDSPDATSDVQALIDELASIQESITSSTYYLLTLAHTWPVFAHTTPEQDESPVAVNSLEGIHNTIHEVVGAGGHMGDIAVAAFDPIFFLHHANVDRLLSIWAAVNPGVWVSSGSSDEGTFTIPADTQVDTNTSLTPFWSSETDFWASSETTETASLQYSYPEFNGLDLSDPGAVQVVISNYINDQYGGGGPRGGLGGVVHDWTARIRFKKYELGRSFSVLIFLGQVPDDPSQWRASPSFVGVHAAFVNSAAGQCANCRDQEDVVVEGFVHLDTAIAKQSGDSSYEPGVVIPYLKDNLRWRVQTANRTVVETEKLSSLEVTVASTPLRRVPGSVFPIPGGVQYYHHITFGRRGGARHG